MRVDQLREEARLLDVCMQQLVRQLSPKCAEWSSTLEVIRQRSEKLWKHAIGVASRAVVLPDATQARVEAGLRQEVSRLRGELAIATARALDAERVAADAAALPRQVALLEEELEGCRQALAERRHR